MDKRESLQDQTVAVYVNSCGNYFMQEIADLIYFGFQDAGHSVRKGGKGTFFYPDVTWHVIIAPHEFFSEEYYKGLTMRLPPKTILVNTEQPGSLWYHQASILFSSAYAIWDIEYESFKKLKGLHQRTAFLPLGYTEQFACWNDIPILPDTYATCHLEKNEKQFSASLRPWMERPIDIIFIGLATERRKKFFAKNAKSFSRYHCYLLLLKDSGGPWIASKNTVLDTPTVYGLMQRSKILLNIHQQDSRYFEWQRMIMQGVANKTLVITESSGKAPPFIQNKDYIQCSANTIAKHVEDILREKSGEHAQAMVDRAYETLKTRCRIGEALKGSMAAIQ